MAHEYACGHKEAFLTNLRLTNHRAGVEPEIIDLIEAYARLRLAREKAVDFFCGSIPVQDGKLKELLYKNRHLDPKVLNFLAAYYLEMKNLGHKCVLTPTHLTRILDISPERLNWLACDAKNHYKRFVMKKRDGESREIFAPKPCLQAVQRRILDDLLQQVKLNSHAQGFRKKRSILTNARFHIGKQAVIKMDLKEFFPSITFDRVAGMFASLGYPRRVAILLTKLVTHGGRLPIGAPTSPAVSNIICRRLDQRFAGLAEKKDFDYSRYADDITVSSDNKRINNMIPLFKEMIRDEGFEINEAKLRILRNGGQQKITGIVTNTKPNIDKKEIRKLRAVIHNCRHKDMKQEMIKWAKREKNMNNPYDYTMSAFTSSLKGKIQFVKMVNPHMGEKLLEQLASLRT